MLVRVLFFGVLKDLAGRAAESLELPENALAGDVLRHYEATMPRLEKFLSSIATSVNQEYASAETRLHAGDEIALLPPVSGGSGDAAKPDGGNGSDSSRVAIVRETINPQEILAWLKRPEDGAVVVFEGIVRNHSRGRRTLYLDYEAYEPMAFKQMKSLAEQALAQFQVREVAIVHRLGRLEIGETSVLIAVVSAHRAAAFEACRWLIDSLKRSVPIWKREYFEDGAVWADGEPFPDEVAQRPGIPAPKLESN